MFATATEALAALGEKLGMPRLQFGADRICTLEIGGKIDLEIEDRADAALLQLNAILRVVGDADASVYHALLTANFNGQGTGKAALSINPASGEIVLTQAIDPKLHSNQSLFDEVDQFTRYALFWADHAQSLKPAPRVSIRETVADASEVTFRL